MQETIVRLKVLSSTQTPEMVTKAIGLDCDHCWHIGDRRGPTIIKEKNHGWVLHSGLPKSTELEEHISALLSVLETRTNALKALSATATLEFSCVIYANRGPGLCFDQKVINKLALLGASLDIDLYYTSEDLIAVT